MHVNVSFSSKFFIIFALIRIPIRTYARFQYEKRSLFHEFYKKKAVITVHSIQVNSFPTSIRKMVGF